MSKSLIVYERAMELLKAHREIAKVLSESGPIPRLSTRKRKVKDISVYDMVIIGMVCRWGNDGAAENFLKKYKTELSQRKQPFSYHPPQRQCLYDKNNEELEKIKQAVFFDKVYVWLNPVSRVIFGGV